MENASDATKELPKYILLQFNSLKLNYTFEDLSKMLYPLGLPNEMRIVDSEGKKVYNKGILDSRYYTRFDSSIYTCDFAIKPSYLAGLIFQFLINKNIKGDGKNKFVEQFNPKKRFLCGKHIYDVKIIGAFSYDSKIVWNHDSRGFSNLVKYVLVADDPKPSIPYVDEEKSAEKIKKIKKESKKLTIFQKKLDKLLEEVAFLIGKHIAATEMKICSKKTKST